MHQSSRPGQMRSPFKQVNASSSSLEGMERPVRSFIKVVPPNPNSTYNKPLPPTPSPPRRSSPPVPVPSSSPPTTPGRAYSVASWKAPADWFNNSREGKPPLPASAIPASRTYSPLLPDPSPDLEKYMEFHTALEQTAQQSRLMPIYEKANPDLGPPRSPPRSPLPRLPASKARKGSPDMPGRQQPTGRPSPAVISGTSPSRVPRTASPSESGSSQRSQRASKEKAFASLGISSPTKQAEILQNQPSPSDSLGDHNRQYIAGKKYRAVNKGSPFAEENWEDPDMDEKTRQLSFSQDYHDMLADQYQEMSVRPRLPEVPEPRTHSEDNSQQFATNVELRHPSHHHQLVPRPLTWRKSSSNSSPRSASRDRNEEAAPTTPEPPSSPKKEARSKKIRSWVPHRLSVGPKPSSRSQQPPSTQTDQTKAVETVGKRYSDAPEVPTKIEKPPTEDLRFSRFFPPSKPLRRLGRKSAKKSDVNVEKGKEPMRDQTPMQIIRLPGGLAVVRSPPRSDSASSVDPSSNPHRGSGETAQSQQQQQQSTDPPPPSTSPTSPQSKHLSTPPTPRPFAHLSSPRNSDSPSHRLSTSPPPKSSKPSWRHSRPRSDTDEEWNKPGFLEKAKEARRRREQENRQTKLKRSIRVLGPTDPDVVASYVREEGDGEGQGGGGGGGGVGRLPGYLVTGTG
ncbi:hypothetical protein P154DRAFT_596858 [Amniculicola lignicola CBS 123094]|uniref:Uncharacterized protein n=1 Tax=Amniculicola lignicola CBS 123094 TaxID=1392246 RepID=A0A6A5WH49_9PLEO|nr:hypothetical protein P154DRAFT_596858 [Amniculicola lignicola CBS 123094]